MCSSKSHISPRNKSTLISEHYHGTILMTFQDRLFTAILTVSGGQIFSKLRKKAIFYSVAIVTLKP